MNLSEIANHPTVLLNFAHDTEQWHFAHYYVALQEQTPTLLSLLDTIDRYKQQDISQPNVFNIPYI